MNKVAGLIAMWGLVLMLGPSLSLASVITLSLIPDSGSVYGPAGSTVGWGYTITNTSSEWLGTLAVSAGSFTHGTPNVIFHFPNVAPLSSVSLDFSLAATGECMTPPCGLYDFAWDSSAPVGTVNSGTFGISSDFFSGNPADPSSVDLGPAPDANASYSASAVPEPSTLLLFVTGCGSLLTLGWRQRQRAA